MALNPSCNSVTKGTPFPVLGDPPFRLDLAEIAKDELRKVIADADLDLVDCEQQTRRVFREGSRGHQMSRAGICAFYEGQENDIEEVQVASVGAKAHGWEFRRAWYYWVCQTSTNPIPRTEAEKLNAKWGDQVRFDGYSGGKNPNGPGTAYHVDTLEGLQALLDVIK